MFKNAVLIIAAFAVPITGTSFDRVIERACQQNPFLPYCTDKKAKSNGNGSQSGLKISGISSDSLLRDPAPEKEVFRSSTREFPTSGLVSETEPEDPFCEEDEARYKHYCQGEIERSSGIQQELFKYCINYETRCPQKTVNKKVEVDRPDWDKSLFATTASPIESIESNMTTEGFIEQPAAAPVTTSPEAPSAEELSQYCEKYEPNFLYFCVGDNNDDAEKARVGRFCEVFAHDCPDKMKRIAANFPAKSIKTTTSETEEGTSESKGKEVEESEIRDYCNEYAKNYNYFCVQGNEAEDKMTIEKFCKAYKDLCQQRKGPKGEGKEGGEEEGGTKPPSPFEAFVTKSSKPEEVFSTFKHPKKLTELAKPRHHRVPCTIDCDPKKHPHCTPECKCDFIYPSVQKFCNPPPMPIFLQTCRMWYTFCPKYKQYHYASQFIYSKSQKGKVQPGRANIPSEALPGRDIPIPFIGGLLGRVMRGARNREVRAVAQPHELRTLRDFAELQNLNTPQKRPFKFAVDEIPPWERAPYTLKLSPGQRPRVYQAPKEGNIHDFDKFTDPGGRVTNQLYSRSPWTKPGLWEANPSNPHNRDHANKFSYNPESVTVDWLNGQIYWGAHWAVPAASVGGTNGYASIHFPSLGPFFGIDDDYD